MDPRRVSCPLTNALVYFYIRSGDLDAAEKIVTEAMGRGDGSGGAVAQLAYIAQVREEWENAENLYRRAMELEPSLGGHSGDERCGHADSEEHPSGRGGETSGKGPGVP
jgi:hypothetical protein